MRIIGAILIIDIAFVAFRVWAGWGKEDENG